MYGDKCQIFFLLVAVIIFTRQNTCDIFSSYMEKKTSALYLNLNTVRNIHHSAIKTWVQLEANMNLKSDINYLKVSSISSVFNIMETAEKWWPMHTGNSNLYYTGHQCSQTLTRKPVEFNFQQLNISYKPYQNSKIHVNYWCIYIYIQLEYDFAQHRNYMHTVQNVTLSLKYSEGIRNNINTNNINIFIVRLIHG
jgi:hypothetical protein